MSVNVKLVSADLPDGRVLILSPTPRNPGETDDEYADRLVREKRAVLLLVDER